MSVLAATSAKIYVFFLFHISVSKRNLLADCSLCSRLCESPTTCPLLPPSSLCLSISNEDGVSTFCPSFPNPWASICGALAQPDDRPQANLHHRHFYFFFLFFISRFPHPVLHWLLERQRGLDVLTHRLKSCADEGLTTHTMRRQNDFQG